MENIANKEKKFIDIAKAIGIIFVVLGHILTNNTVSRFIYLFHMPLFFFISGYLFSQNYFSNPYVCIEKKLKSLYVPYIKWMIIFTVIHNFLFKIHFYDEEINQSVTLFSDSSFKIHLLYTLQFRGGELLLPTFWFIPALFMTNYVFVSYGYFFRNRKSDDAFVLLAVISFVWGGVRIKNGYTPFLNCNQVYIALHIFILGYLYRKYERYIQMKWQRALLCICILTLLAYNGVRVDMSHNIYPNYFLFILGEICGIYLVIFLAKLLCCKINKMVSLLIYIGKNSFLIMTLHIVAFKVISFIAILINHDEINKLALFPVYTREKIWTLPYLCAGVFIPLTYGKLCEIVKEWLQKYRRRDNYETKD